MKLENGCWNTDVRRSHSSTTFLDSNNSCRNMIFTAFLPSKSYEKASDWQDLFCIHIVDNQKRYGAEAERSRMRHRGLIFIGS